MEAFLNLIISKITGLAKWFGDIFVAIFKAFWDLIKDAFSWVFEQVLDVAISAINSIDLSGLDGYSSAWSSMPSEVLNVLAYLGVAQAVAIITTAIIIRLALQLIPFVRLGS